MLALTTTVQVCFHYLAQLGLAACMRLSQFCALLCTIPAAEHTQTAVSWAIQGCLIQFSLRQKRVEW